MPELSADLVPLAMSVLLVGLRVGIVFVSLPAPFGDLSPMSLRAVLSLMIAFAVVLATGNQLSAAELEPLVLLRAAIGEVLVGGVIGLTSRVILITADLAGTMIGFSMGLGFAASIDPELGETTLPTTRLVGSFAALIFLLLEGHHLLIAAVAATVRVAPPGEVFAAIDLAGIPSIGATMMAQALRIASPVVATMFLVQLGTAFVSRAAPRVHVFALSFGVAIAAGMIVLFVAAPSLATALGTHIQRLPARLSEVLGGL